MSIWLTLTILEYYYFFIRIKTPSITFLSLLPASSHKLQRHYTENSKQIFPEIKLRGLVTNSNIHVSVSDLFIPTISLPTLLQENRWSPI